MDELTAAALRWGVEPGYYDVFGRWQTASPETLRRLIAALSSGRGEPAHIDTGCHPIQAFQGDGRRYWALAVQLYALRSRRNWGHGDFSDLAQLIRIAASCGAAGIGLNPLHALFLDHPGQASPYSPNSRLYLNPLYIDVEAIEEFPGLAATGLEAEVVALRATDLIDYSRVAKAKVAGLHLAYACFRRSATGKRRADFDAYRKEQGEGLLRFACFGVLRQRYALKPWLEWPEPWRNPASRDLQEFRQENREACEFYEFMQWVADRQLQACKETAQYLGMPVGLYTDIAVGIDRHGFGAWAQQDAVMTDVSIGAPPDDFNPAGQDWGLVPFNPHRLLANDFRVIRRLLRASMRHARAIRLDHVLGLKRVFMIPCGLGAAGGTYVHFPFEALLRVVAEESNSLRCTVIGEDLGTVPDGFRETLACWGLWTYRVMLFERQADGRFREPVSYPAEAVATFTTHDLPTFRGWITGYDLQAKRAIGFDPGETEEARNRSRQALRAALGEWAPDYPADDIAAVASFLGATPCRLAVMSLEDVLGVLDQINIPGTVDQHPNWQRKLPALLEDLESNESLARVARAFAIAGRSFVPRG